MERAAKRQFRLIHARLLLHMSIKALRRHLNLFEPDLVQNWRSRRRLSTATSQLGLGSVVVDCKARRNLECTSDLSTVPAAGRSGEFLVMLGGKVDDFIVLDHKGWLASDSLSLRLDLLELGDIETEDLAGLRLVERRLDGISVRSLEQLKEEYLHSRVICEYGT